MSVIETRLRIADMSAEHYRDSEAFQRGQATAVADLLLEVVLALNVPRELEPVGKALFMGTWTPDQIIATAEAAAASAAIQSGDARTDS